MYFFNRTVVCLAFCIRNELIYSQDIPFYFVRNTQASDNGLNFMHAAMCMVMMMFMLMMVAMAVLMRRFGHLIVMMVAMAVLMRRFGHFIVMMVAMAVLMRWFGNFIVMMVAMTVLMRWFGHFIVMMVAMTMMMDTHIRMNIFNMLTFAVDKDIQTHTANAV